MTNTKIRFYILFYIIFIELFFFLPILQAKLNSVKPWFNKVILLKTYQQSYDWLNPWEKSGIQTKTGMALVVDLAGSKNNGINETTNIQKYHLLTTAEMVANSTLIEATRRGIIQPFRAKLLRMDYAANLALLGVDDDEFWKKLKPSKLYNVKSINKSDKKFISTLKIKSSEEWELDSGTIEQMAVGYREKSNAWFPILKIKGFSRSGQGYPVIQDNKTVGMILESKSGETKAIPAEMLLEFFKHSTNKSNISLAHRGFQWKKLPQRSTAEYFKIPHKKPGIWISKVLSYGTGFDVLKKGDYLTKIGEWSISYEGKINHPTWGISLFDLLFLDKLKVGDNLKLNVIRNGKSTVLNTKVSDYKENGGTIPLRKVGHPPRFVIQGGFLFQELTLNYLYMWGKNWKSRAPIRLRLFLEQNNTVMINGNKKYVKFNSENLEEIRKNKIVLVTQVIPDQINIGYQSLSNAIVLNINERKINSLQDVKDAFLNPKNNFHRIDFLPGSNRLSVVLPVQDLKKSNLRIKENFRIPKLQSL